MSRGLSLAAVVLALLVAGCISKEDFETCKLTEKMLADCDLDQFLTQPPCNIEPGQDEPSASCYKTCLVKDHPQCDTSVCMVFQFREVGGTTPYKTPAFCSVGCSLEGALACYDGTTCQADKGRCADGTSCDLAKAATDCADKSVCKVCQDGTTCIARTCPEGSKCLGVAGGAYCLPEKYAPATATK